MALLSVESLAHGGAGVGRIDGRVVFCPDTVPGDRVEVDLISEKKTYAIGKLVEIVAPAAFRRQAPCPVFDRCGGCDWQMMVPSAQESWKQEIVRSQLVHLGRLEDPPVVPTFRAGSDFRYRNRIDVRVVNGRPALFEAQSRRPVVIEDCPLVLEAISARLRDFEGLEDAERVTLRASEASGELVEIPRRNGRWGSGVLHETVAGRRFRISGRAFFQVNTAGASVLVDLVSQHLQVGEDDVLIDGYAGGGLFAATVGSKAARVVAVESNRLAISDLRVNAPRAEVLARPFEQAPLPAATAAVVDPPRSGLGRDGVAALLGAGPERIAYVSCDPAALARDAHLLDAAGYSIDRVTPVDMFPNTHHIEAVAWLTRR